MSIILHIPHASTIIPYGNHFLADQQTIQEELLKLTDWHTEDLFSAPGHLQVIAPYSRIFCDTERFIDDSKEIMSAKGMGVLYSRLDDGRPLREVDEFLKQTVIQQYYIPHHRNLSEAVISRLRNNGYALILDCHSFPDKPLCRDLNTDLPRPDFNIGTDPFHTPAELIDASAEFFDKKGFSLGIDWPYAGTIVPMNYYKKHKSVRSIMLEINRKLYLEEGSSRKSEQYPLIKTVTKEYIELLDRVNRSIAKKRKQLI